MDTQHTRTTGNGRTPAPARNAVSEQIAEQIVQEMNKRGITRDDLADRVEQITGRRPHRMWISRTLNGQAHFTVMVPSEVPNDLLRLVAQAIDPHNETKLAERLGRVARKVAKESGAQPGSAAAS